MTALTFTIRRKAIKPFTTPTGFKVSTSYTVNGALAGFTPSSVRKHIRECLGAEGFDDSYTPSIQCVTDACFDASYCNPEIILDKGRWKIGINA